LSGSEIYHFGAWNTMGFASLNPSYAVRPEGAALLTTHSPQLYPICSANPYPILCVQARSA